MTDAQVSQIATEVLRTNLAVEATLSQLAVEVLVSNIANAAGSASGSSTASAVGEIGTIIENGVGSASGTSSANATVIAVIQSVGSANGSSSSTVYGLAGIQGVGSISGTSACSSVGIGAGLAIAFSQGNSIVIANGVTAPSFLTAGTSQALGVGRVVHGAETQIPGGVSCDNDTQDANGDSGNDGSGITTQILGPIACGTLTGSFTAGPAGIYAHSTICSQTTIGSPDNNGTPAKPFDPVWSWANTSKVAKCCDVSWSGDEIILGTYSGNVVISGNAISCDGHVYVSRDKGKSWIQQPPSDNNWAAVTMTANASLLGAYSVSNTLHYISNDGGAGWAPVGHPWGSSILLDAKVSDLGNKFIVTTQLTGWIYTSDNYAVTWNAVIPWPSVPMWYDSFKAGDLSSDGKIIYAGRYHPSIAYGYMTQSTNSGASWESLSAAGAWIDMACSGDGRYILASGSGFSGARYTYTSNNKGVSFTTYSVAADKCAMSTSGQVQAYIENGRLVLSKNYGLVFSIVTELPATGATDVAINANGSVIVVCYNNNYVYVGSA